MGNKTVYVGMSVEILHHGHINILNEASKYGDVTVGLLTDEAIASHKRLPLLKWEDRKKIVEKIQGVVNVIPQNEWDYSLNVSNMKPDFFIHGTDWLTGPSALIRERVLATLDSYGGTLIEVPYTEGISTSELWNGLRSLGTSAQIRQSMLRRLIETKEISRFIETHSPLSAIIAENSQVNIQKDGIESIREFDGFWSSSLTDSTFRGLPDTEVLSLGTRMQNISEIFDVTTKPLIMDADTGGQLDHFALHVKTMERIGISACIIEDKTGLKKNSLLGNDVAQTQEEPSLFAEKIKAGRSALVGNQFMVIARIESLILEKGMKDALSRAEIYADAGADAIMIHSREKNPDEIFTFSNEFKKSFPHLPLVVVPTSFSQVAETELVDNQFNIVIYANHLLRATYPAMQGVANSILRNGRAHEVENDIMSISQILKLVPGTS